MKRMTLTLLIVVLLKPIAGFCYHMQISPPVLEVSTRPGCLKVFDLRIANYGDETVKCRITSTGLGVAEDGRTFPTNSDSIRGCSKWIEFKPSEFNLAPGKQMAITCKLRSPNNSIGGYYAMLICNVLSENESKINNSKSGDVELSLGVRLSSALLVSVSAVNADAEVKTHEPDISSLENKSLFSGKKLWKADVPLENVGNDHDIIKGQISILKEDGSFEDKAELKAGAGYILPGQTRTFTAVGHKTLLDGFYVLKADIFLTKYRKRGEVSFPFTVKSGKFSKEKPSPEMEELLKKTRPVFSLDPTEIVFTLAPRAKQSKAIQLTNITDDTISAHVQICRWNQKSDGSIYIISEKDSLINIPTSCITISPDTFHLAPNQHTTIKLTWQMPIDSKGEFYPALKFVPDNRVLIEEPSLVIERSVLISATAKGTDSVNLELKDFSVEFIPSVGFDLKYSLNNKGNVSNRIVYSLGIVDDKGDNVTNQMNIDEECPFILPNVTREYKHNLPTILKPGKYKITLYCSYNQDLSPLSKSVFYTKK
jgi:hypothetical protein